jgi:flagellar hook-associated protein 1 FlgK
MGLSTTLNIAQTALSTNATLSSMVSRNIAGANNPNYSRKTGEVTSDGFGSAKVASVTQATDSALFTHLLSATSDAASSTALLNGLNQLEQTVSLTSTATSSDSTTTDTSPATLITTLTSALQNYAASPSDDALAQSVVSAAQSLASGLNAASAAVQSVRTQADADIGSAVTSINSLLAQFQTVNEAIVKGTATGRDTTDLVDTRGSLLTSLSQQMGITTVTGSNGDMSIYTDGGTTLFQGTARKVAFTPSGAFAAGTTGGAVTVDGVPVTGPSAAMPIKSGAIAGLATLRDKTTVAYQNQLDQIAQGLVSTFADKDASGGSAPTIPGLFTAAGASATAATAPVGLAAAIKVSPNVDPTQGGVLTRLRDGDIGNPGNSAYDGNPTGAASYSSHLTSLLNGLDAKRSFDPTSGGSASATLAGYAASSVSWLEAARQGATTTSTSRNAVVAQTTTSLSSATGVNLDDELSKMLDLEHAYQASAELMQTVKSMFGTLLSAMQ